MLVAQARSGRRRHQCRARRAPARQRRRGDLSGRRRARQTAATAGRARRHRQHRDAVACRDAREFHRLRDRQRQPVSLRAAGLETASRRMGSLPRAAGVAAVEAEIRRRQRQRAARRAGRFLRPRRQGGETNGRADRCRYVGLIAVGGARRRRHAVQAEPERIERDGRRHARHRRRPASPPAAS